MRNTNLTKLTKEHIKEGAEVQGLSKDTTNNLYNFKSRLIGNLENPFSEYGVKSMNILNMKDTTPDEELDMKVGQMFGYSLNKMWEMVKKDRSNEQINKMLAPFGINEGNGASDDYYYKNAIGA